MAGRFVGFTVLHADTDCEVLDPVVQSQARCLMLLLICAKYLRDLDKLCPSDLSSPIMGPDIQALTNVLAINLLKATSGDPEQLDFDIQRLAAHLDIQLQVIGIHAERSTEVN